MTQRALRHDDEEVLEAAAPDLIEELAQSKARQSFAGFRRYMHPAMLRNWWTEEVAAQLQQFYLDCLAKRRPRLALMAPPQHGKSSAVTDFVAWLAGRQPHWRSIFASYSDELGIRANTDITRIFKSERFRAAFGRLQIGLGGDWKLNSELIEFAGHRGSFRNVTVRGGITGMGMDVGIIDDPVKGRAEASSKLERDKLWNWFTDDFQTRFSKNAGMLIVMTRWHVDDLLGRFIERQPDVKQLRYTALAETPERHRKPGEALFPAFKPLSFLEEQRKTMTQASWEALYQQNPVVTGGGVFPVDKLLVIPLNPERKTIRASVRAWDKAGTSGGTGAETAGVLLHALLDGHYLVGDVIHGRWSALEREQMIKAAAAADRASFGNYEIVVEQEPGSGGKESAEATIRNLAGYRAYAERVTGSKEVRAEPFAAQVQSGNVWLLAAPWVNAFREEAEIWPQGKLRDMIDAAAMAFNRLTAQTTFNTNYSQWA